MPLQLQDLEDVVYSELEDSDGVGLHPDDAKSILSQLDQDNVSERIRKILEHLGEESMDKNDRKKITTSLLQLLESYRQESNSQQDKKETSLSEEFLDLARKAKEHKTTDTTFLDDGIELINAADDEAFKDAQVTREDARNFLLDIRNEVEDADQPHGVVVHALNNIGNAL